MYEAFRQNATKFFKKTTQVTMCCKKDTIEIDSVNRTNADFSMVALNWSKGEMYKLRAHGHP